MSLTAPIGCSRASNRHARRTRMVAWRPDPPRSPRNRGPSRRQPYEPVILISFPAGAGSDIGVRTHRTA